MVRHRARVGWLPAPTWLLYATGGAAFGEIETTGTLTGLNPMAAWSRPLAARARPGFATLTNLAT
jgi:hypothetical protein